MPNLHPLRVKLSGKYLLAAAVAVTATRLVGDMHGVDREAVHSEVSGGLAVGVALVRAPAVPLHLQKGMESHPDF